MMKTRESNVIKGLRMLLQQFRARNSDDVKFIGQDHLGNKYYEGKNDRPGGKLRRFYKDSDKRYEGPVEVDLSKRIPPAWDSWLRHRRNDPPSLEEVIQSDSYFEMQQSRAAEKKSLKSSVED